MSCAVRPQTFNDELRPQLHSLHPQRKLSFDVSGGARWDAMRGCERSSVAGEILQCSVTLKISESQHRNIVPTV